MGAGYVEELVFAGSEDGFELDGAVIRPDEAATRPLAVVWVHGFTGHFNERFVVAIGRDLARRGYTFVSGNNRGHRIGVGLASRGGQPILGGGWWELISEAPRDIAAWIGFAVGLGFPSVVLVGHSLGGVKVLAYQAERQDPRVRGLVAASPGIHMGPNARRNPSEIAALAERMLAEGCGQELLPWGTLPGGRTLSAQTYLDRLRPEWDVAGLEIPDPPVARIRCPLLALAGSEEAQVLTAADLETLRRRATAAPRVDTRLFAGADHLYRGHEAEVAAALTGWIATLG